MLLGRMTQSMTVKGVIFMELVTLKIMYPTHKRIGGPTAWPPKETKKNDPIKHTSPQHINAYTIADFHITSSPKVEMIVSKLWQDV